MSENLLERLHIEEFLYYEARLIDEERFDEWLEIFTEDSVYWVPCNGNNIDPKRQVSIIYDDKKRLSERIWRLQTGLAYGQEPRSKTRHILSNVHVVERSEEKLTVSSNFILVELRRGKQTNYAGRMEYQLRKVDSSYKIKSKKVELINNNEPLGNLSFVL